MNNTLIMPFIDESENFVNGFEAGQIWEILKQGEVIENRPCHLSNKEQIKMICETLNCNYTLGDSENGWTILNVFKSVV